MTDTRLATDMELKHYQELIAPLLDLVDDMGEPTAPTPAKAAITRRVMGELDRFGFIPNPIHLLVRLDPSCYDVVLDAEQEAAVKADLEHVWGIMRGEAA